ncbi:MAG: hypothetical protein AAB834_05390, partial [Patescibacteria group bacterium]
LEKVSPQALAVSIDQGIFGSLPDYVHMAGMRDEHDEVLGLLDKVAHMGARERREYLWGLARAPAEDPGSRAFAQWQELFADRESDMTVLEARLSNITEGLMDLLGAPAGFIPNGNWAKNRAVGRLRECLKNVAQEYLEIPVDQRASLVHA